MFENQSFLLLVSCPELTLIETENNIKNTYDLLDTVLKTFLFHQGIFLFFCINSKPLVLGAYVYPSWANSIGWIMSLVSMLCVPAGIFYYFANNGWSYSRAASEVVSLFSFSFV